MDSRGLPSWIDPEPHERRMIVVFWDLTGFLDVADSMSPVALFGLMDGYFQMASHLIETDGGAVVKAIGDAGLAVFPDTDPDGALETCLRLQRQGNTWLASRNTGMRTQLALNIGTVACGTLGAPGRERFDVYGATVNQTALLLKAAPIVVSTAVYIALSDHARHHFARSEAGFFTWSGLPA